MSELRFKSPGGILNNSNTFEAGEKLLEQIFKYVDANENLTLIESELSDCFIIEQKLDSHRISINMFDVEEVLSRFDEQGREFLQINFISGKKILLTQKLIGFRPLAIFGLDMKKLPKVVTTPDIMNIFDAIQESLCNDEDPTMELEILRKIYDSIVCGGESVGFDLKEERKLFTRIPTQIFLTTA